MNNEYIRKLFAQRLGGENFGDESVLYKFEKIKRAKKRACKANPDVKLLDLGVGEPDWMAEKKVIDILFAEASKKENRGYSDNGVQEFKDAAVHYMEQVYGVQGLDAYNEVIHGIGSKSILALLPQAFIDPGDITLMTVPGYPIIGSATKALGGEVVFLPLTEKNQYLPDLSLLAQEQCRKAKLLYLNYPNNPTGASATREFFEAVVAFARKHQIIVVADAAYAALTFAEEKPLSFLSVPGAKEVGVEIHSLSKAFNMTGWRLAFLCGQAAVIKGFAAVKDNHDSGQFAAIQKAGVYCLKHPEITRKTAERYERRHSLLVNVLQRIGFRVVEPKASFYLYTAIPKRTKTGRRFADAEDFSEFLLKEKLISTIPWDDAGAYIRFSVTFEAETEKEEAEVMEELEQRLTKLELIF
nr:LL-diaminopimelate aminotransferase [uncultured Anaeromusa sp.]